MIDKHICYMYRERGLSCLLSWLVCYIYIYVYIHIYIHVYIYSYVCISIAAVSCHVHL